MITQSTLRVPLPAEDLSVLDAFLSYIKIQDQRLAAIEVKLLAKLKDVAEKTSDAPSTLNEIEEHR